MKLSEGYAFSQIFRQIELFPVCTKTSPSNTMSTPTAITAGSSSERNQKPSGSSNPSPENSPLSTNSSSPENSQVREGQKSSAAIADVPTVMSESTLRIIAAKEADKQAEKRKGPGSIPDYKYHESFWATVTTAQHKLYYQETGLPIRMFLFSI